MRILINTPDRLLLSDQSLVGPILFGVLAALFLVMAWFAWSNAPGISLGMLLIGAMLVFGVVVSLGHSTAEFSRTAGQVTIRTSGPFGRAPQTLRLGTIREVYAQPGSHSTGSGLPGKRGYRPALLLQNAAPSVPLSRQYRSAASAGTVVHTVNEWLSATRTKH